MLTSKFRLFVVLLASGIIFIDIYNEANVYNIDLKHNAYGTYVTNDAPCHNLSGIYVITIHSEIKSEPLKEDLELVVSKLNLMEIEIVDVFEKLGIIIIKIMDEEVYNNIKNQLLTDKLIKSIESSECRTISRD